MTGGGGGALAARALPAPTRSASSPMRLADWPPAFRYLTCLPPAHGEAEGADGEEITLKAAALLSAVGDGRVRRSTATAAAVLNAMAGGLDEIASWMTSAEAVEAFRAWAGSSTDSPLELLNVEQFEAAGHHDAAVPPQADHALGVPTVYLARWAACVAIAATQAARVA